MEPTVTRIKPIYKLLIALLSATALFGAGWTWLQAGEAAPPAITVHSFQEGRLEWQIGPYPAKALHANAFEITLQDSSGNPLRSAALAVNLEMVGMEHGDNAIELKEESPGVYRGEGVPVMAGMWKATLSLETKEQSYSVSRKLSVVY